jgi:hypothetical protein
VSGLPPLPGDPGAVRLLADRLASTARRLAALASVLAGLRDGATWDGPAGDAFGARLHEVTPVLDTVALRLGGAAAPLQRLAEALEQAQHVVAAAVRDDDDAEHAYAVLEERAYALVSAGSTEDSPDLLVVRHLQRDQAEVRALARARHAAAAETFRAADRRCAHALAGLAVDAVTDSLSYRTVVGASSLGHDLSSVGAVAAAVPWLRPVAAVGDVMGLAADAALLVGYGEGDVNALAAGAALAATGGAAGALRRGAVAGARQTPTGIVVTRRLTAQERLRLGTVAEVRARRDDLRARFTVPPERGTSSSLVGGPPIRARPSVGPASSPGASGPPGPAGRLGAGSPPGPQRSSVPGRGPAFLRASLDARIVRARALGSARLDAAFRADWRLATANGPTARRMYASGVTLEVATTAGERAVATVDDEAGADPRTAPSGR